jgi:hypothetical protein
MGDYMDPPTVSAVQSEEFAPIDFRVNEYGVEAGVDVTEDGSLQARLFADFRPVGADVERRNIMADIGQSNAARPQRKKRNEVGRESNFAELNYVWPLSS